ncbi:hypothetical protein [Staphylococcus shinii]|uniref:hypothetical protein n=1 Tax=Staphylococcus shinii TaxID=2912228 RepID=UPI00298F2DFB|nr:hypothetical protein [Staphylococcus shinii]MDW8564025.1 hypothetical protein [Staphylococcus shinii]
MVRFSIRRVVLTGAIGGFLAGAVKIGWEGLLPPRTPKVDEIPPEEHFSELIGHIIWMNTIDFVRNSVK